jgi:hypothetical protein
MSSPVFAKALADGVIQARPATGYVLYHGFTIRESNASPAVAAVNIREGSVSGKILESIELAANQSAGDFYERGIMCEDDLYCQVVTGTVEGSVRYS